MTATHWCRLEELATVSLGLKSLQNEFFYLEPSTVTRYGVERSVLTTVFRMKDLNAGRYLQSGDGGVQFLSCKTSPSDLRGTGAWRYISAMARQPASRKKQTKGHQAETIQTVLERQSGGTWYAPKAVPVTAHIWLRKAFGGVFAPFIFPKGGVCDQRCNAMRPKRGTTWEELGSVVTSTLFALALESAGSSSLGGGALEVPTRRLRLIKVFDPRSLSSGDRGQLVKLAGKVWSTEAPVDWSKGGSPGKALVALDSWLLKNMGHSPVTDDLYSDVERTCASRYLLAKEKARASKASTQVDLTSVAESIADSVRPQLQARQFPEAFIRDAASALVVDLPVVDCLVIEVQPMLANISLRITMDDGEEVMLERAYPRAVAEVLVRSLLLGRRRMTVPGTEDECHDALKYLSQLIPAVEKAISAGCNASALGTRFEASVRQRTLEVLGIRGEVLRAELPSEIRLPT